LGHNTIETDDVGQQMRNNQQQQINPEHNPKIQFTKLIFHAASCLSWCMIKSAPVIG
jgi:hypothetical protein